MSDYRSAKAEKLGQVYGGIEINCHVLGSNNWPISQNVKCVVPSLIKSIHDDFEAYYKHRNQGKAIKYCI